MRTRCLCVWVYALRRSAWMYTAFGSCTGSAGSAGGACVHVCACVRVCVVVVVVVVCVCVCLCVCVYMAVAHPARANIFCHKFEKALSSLAAHLDIHRSTPTQPQIHTQTQSQTHKRTQADRQRHSHLCFPGRNEKLLHSDNPVRIVNSSCLGQPVRYLQGNTIFITLVRTILQ
jgi:hypothetical protein